VTPRLLDLTRLVSRLGGPPLTGIDRVELAWLRALLARQAPVWALVRTRTGFALLDRGGMERIAALAAGEPLPEPDWISRLARRRQPVRAGAETAARRVAVARSWRGGLARLLARLPPGVQYFNVGHADLTPGVLRVLRRLPGARIAVLLHDTIPVDRPDLASAGAPAAFARKLAVVARADHLVFTTNAARQAAQRHLPRMPATMVAPLGTDLPRPGPLPSLPGLPRPYFLMLGTIEPRKNHALILDVWEALPDPPGLVIAGRRGWADAALLARLDAVKTRLPQVIEAPGLADPAVAALMRDAAALLFPSLAEGFGLPPVEALALGTPVLAADLPVLREVLGSNAVYLPPTDPYAWRTTILRALSDPLPRPAPVIPLPWESHVNAVLRTMQEGHSVPLRE
jgi:glycosyltransferase involved in cell wall biosynthesis